MTEAPAAPLILTKLRVPALRARLVRRARLVEQLALEPGSGLLLVCAPAGYGKTTLFVEWAHWLQKYGFAVAWYALDPADDDPLPFISYLVASLMQALGPLPGLVETAQLLRSAPETDLRRVLPAVVNAMAGCDRECVIILDDYHLISAPAIHSALAFLVEHLPENAHIAIGSRADPPLPLARLRARGRLVEIRADGLRFTADEAVLFLNQVMRLELSPALVTVLEARTEGWVAGLQLAALAMQAPLAQAGGDDPERRAAHEAFISSFSGGHRYLADYLLEEVFNGLPAQAQAFLLDTSILERMCAPLCDAVLGDSGWQSENILRQLEQGNLFVVALDNANGSSYANSSSYANTPAGIADGTGAASSPGAASSAGATWYRYHHLFRDFLQARLRKTALPRDSGAGRIDGLHRAASEWLAAHTLLREAARHAFQTEGWEYAAAFVEQHSFTLIIYGEVSLIYEWCAAFPEEVMRAHPLLCVLQCWPLVFRFRRENRARIEERLRLAGQALAGMTDAQRILELTEHAAVVRSFLAMAPDPTADPQAQLELARAALAHYPDDDPGRFSTLLTMGYAFMAQHDAQSAAQVLETAHQIALQAGLYYGVVELTFHLARLETSQGRLRQAAERCLQGQADIAAMFASSGGAGGNRAAANREGAMLALPAQGLPALGGLDIALGCVLLEQDHLEEAEQRLLRGLERIDQRMNPYYLLTAYAGLFRLREIQGRSAEALEFLARLEAAWPDIAFCARGLRVAHALRIAMQGTTVGTNACGECRDMVQSAGIRRGLAAGFLTRRGQPSGHGAVWGGGGVLPGRAGLDAGANCHRAGASRPGFHPAAARAGRGARPEPARDRVVFIGSRGFGRSRSFGRSCGFRRRRGFYQGRSFSRIRSFGKS